MGAQQGGPVWPGGWADICLEHPVWPPESSLALGRLSHLAQVSSFPWKVAGENGTLFLPAPAWRCIPTEGLGEGNTGQAGPEKPATVLATCSHEIHFPAVAPVEAGSAPNAQSSRPAHRLCPAACLREAIVSPSPPFHLWTVCLTSLGLRSVPLLNVDKFLGARPPQDIWEKFT